MRPTVQGAALRRPRWACAAAVTVLLVSLVGFRWRRSAPLRQRVGPFDDLPAARVAVDSERREIVIELPPTDVPASQPYQEMAMVLLPVYRAELPTSGAVFRARVELVDAAGRRLPQQLLHHFNLTDPGRRELFLPISLHILAASRETPPMAVPRLLFGLPVERGQRFLASAMLGNPGPTAYHGVRVRLVLGFEPAGRLWPLFPGYPWVLDVLFPLGHPPHGSKAFDLPPGRSTHSYESSPAIPGRIVGLGGHLHDYGVELSLTDATTGDVLWKMAPLTDGAGHVTSVPTSLLMNWHRLGVHIVPAHRYRVTAVYDNPTGRLIPDGGMGVVAGLFVPDRGTRWPAVDSADTLYQHDLRATLRADQRGARAVMQMDMSH